MISKMVKSGKQLEQSAYEVNGLAAILFSNVSENT